MIHFRRLSLLCIAALLVAGCGGGGTGPSLTRAASVSIQIAWPAAPAGRGRLIPIAANSVAVEVFYASYRVAHTSFQRTAGSTEETKTLSNLPVGNLTFVISTYQEAEPFDSAGHLLSTIIPLSTKTKVVNIQPGPNTLSDFVLDTTAASISVDTSVAQIGAPDVPLAMTERDSKQRVLPAPAQASQEWYFPQADPGDHSVRTSDTADILQVGGTWVLRPKQDGVVRVAVTDTETGVSGAGVIVVTASVTTVDVHVSGLRLYTGSVRVTFAQDLGLNGASPASFIGTSRDYLVDNPAGAPTADTISVPVLQTGTTTLTLKVQAFAGAGSQGGLLAEYTQTGIADISPPSSVDVDLGSYLKVKAFRIDPADAGAIKVVQGVPRQLSAVALNGTDPSANSIDTIRGSLLQWSSSDTSKVTVDVNGIVTAKTSSAAKQLPSPTVTVADKYDSGIRGTVTAIVVDRGAGVDLTIN